MMNFANDREEVQALLGSMFAGAGGSPGQPYTPPKEDPTNPYVPAPQKLADANIVGYEDWTTDGPVEQGPIPSLLNTQSIDQGKLKTLMDEIADMRRRGVFL
jgi:hypothetical protein